MGTHSLCLLLLLIFSDLVWSEETTYNYHAVGWLNTFVPGGGELMMGRTKQGLTQAAIEVGTFSLGYHFSKKTPFTLDGVGTDIPKDIDESRGHVSSDRHKTDISNELIGDIFQEVGIKYHMVNVFNSYRRASAGRDSRIDDTSTKDLFLAPFKLEILKDRWVSTGISVSVIAVVLNFFTAPREHTAQLNGASNSLYALNYAAVYPIGSAAPEEMFYRGFLQNELYTLIPSPYFSVPTAGLLYGLSHSADDLIVATLSGTYSGMLVHRDKGKLSHAIAYHFWSDLAAGIMATTLLARSQRGFKFGFSFSY